MSTLEQTVARLADDGVLDAAEIASRLDPADDPVYNSRFITNEMDHWYKRKLTGRERRALVWRSASTGDERWDALLQGLVARFCDVAGLEVPYWATVARADPVWSPYGEVLRDDGWYLMSVMMTPVELLDRGVVFDRKNLVRI